MTSGSRPTPQPSPSPPSPGPDTVGATDPTDLPAPGAAGLHGPAGDITPEPPGRYVLLSELGRGGQSIVRVARDLHLRREVAFKQLVSPLGGAERFIREARLTARLDHPGIVAVHELGHRADGALYATQKLIRGETLAQRLDACETLDARLLLLKHFVDICYAVGYAHQRDVIHRDLKPENIMLGAFGETVVLDWGIARLGAVEAPSTAGAAHAEPEHTGHGAILGTPGYMAPEQARGDTAAVGPHSDVWSLGAILYEILTGARAIDQPTPQLRLQFTASQPVPPVAERQPEIPAELAAICERCLHREPDRRFVDAAALAAEVERFRAGHRVSTYTYSRWELLRRVVRRHRLASGLVALMAVGAGIAAWAVRAERDRAVAALQDAVHQEMALFLERARNDRHDGRLNAALDDVGAVLALGPSVEAETAQLYDGARRLPVRITGTPATARVWSASPDLRQCVAAGPLDTTWVFPCGSSLPARVIAGHPGDVPPVFSPDGKVLALQVGALGGGAAGWQSVVGDHLEPLPGQPPGVDSRAMAFSNDGHTRAWEQAGQVHVLRGMRKAPGDVTADEWVLAPDAGVLSGLLFSPDGTQLLVSGQDSIVYNMATGAAIQRLADFRAAPAVFLPDGSALVAADADRQSGYFLWSLSDGRLRVLDRHGRTLTALALDAAGRTVAAASADGDVRLVDLDTERILFRHSVSSRPLALAFETGTGPDTLGVLTQDGRTHRVDLSRLSSARPASVDRRPASRLTYSADGTFLAVGAGSGRLTLLRASDGQVLATVERVDGAPKGTEPPNAVTALAFHPDGRHLMVGLARGAPRSFEFDGGHLDQPVTWEMPGGTPSAAAEPVRALATLADAKLLLVGDRAGELFVLDGDTIRGRLRPFKRGALTQIRAALDGRHLYVGGEAGQVVEIAVDPSAPNGLLTAGRVLAELSGPVRALAVEAGGERLAAAGGDDTAIYILPLTEDAEHHRLVGHTEPVTGLVFLPGRDVLASAAADRTVRLWDAENGEARLTMDDPAFGEWTSLEIAPDDRTLAGGDTSGVVGRIPLP